MDRRDNQEQNLYAKELKNEKAEEYDTSRDYIAEADGKKYHVPYHIIKEVTFNNVSHQDLVSMEYAARLQYRIMLLEPVIKARVEYVKNRIIVIYNPTGADNMKDKMSLDELIAFFEKEGIHIEKSAITERDYDYYKEFYTYAHNPERIRERPPYGYTMEEWKKIKPEWEKKMAQADFEKPIKQAEWQAEYAAQYPEVFGKDAPAQAQFKFQKEGKPSLIHKILGKKGAKGKEKGFWFHGV
jgi:hypothetical protein